EHLALALIMTAEVRELLNKKNSAYKSLESALLDLISRLQVSLVDETTFSGRLIQALSAAEALSIRKNHTSILVSDMLLSLIENKNKYGALGALLGQYFLDEKRDEKDIENKNTDHDKLSFFSYVENINQQIKNNEIDPVFGRENECERIVQILSRKSRNNPLLIGEPGVGRSSIIYALVKRVLKQNVPSYLFCKEILNFDVSALVAGTTLRGQFEERLRKILAELAECEGRYILLVKDMSSLFGAGGEGASDAANLIKPSLTKGEIQMIGLISPDLYKKYVEPDQALKRHFQPVWIEQPTVSECQLILENLKSIYERFHGVFIENEALKAAIDLGSKHMTGRVLPEVALDILDEACARHRIAIDKKPASLIKITTDILELEMMIAVAEEESGKKIAAKNARLVKLRVQEQLLEKCYSNEISLIESIRALKAQLSDAQSQAQEYKEQRNAHEAAQLMQYQIATLTDLLEEKIKEWRKIKKSHRLIDPWVKRDDIASIVSQETGIPVQKMIQSERTKLASMEQILGAQVIGQNSAVTAVASAIRRARVGLKDPKKPIGSFLFLGPTGVGKTELARTLTSFLFDDERAMVRFDMSEFMERHSVARLIGAPPGYQGSDDGGQLTELVRQKPFSVVLFDEIEKAHIDVLNVLLQVLDEGHLTDSKGRQVLFNNTVIIMTSNVGSDIILDSLGEEKDILQHRIMDRLLQLLRPELINRIDEIVMFEAIDKKGLAGIADLMLDKLKHRVYEQGFSLSISPQAKEILINEGYNQKFGARPLKRAIQRLIEAPLAEILVESQLNRGTCIKVNCEDGIIKLLKNN
ncbi:MAG: AAA family ATPase, partial [Myxococcales bacterium]|nr:AAA family ATPase [Myxococcales bacterium]